MTNITHVQFHIGDFLSGVMQMDGAEIGAYTMMIMAHYQAGVNGLPDNDKKLMQITRTNPKVWKRIKDAVLEKFILEDGFWKHHRVIEELEIIHSKAGPGRGNKSDEKPEKKSQSEPTKDTLGSPKDDFEKPTSDSQVKNKSLKNNNSQKTNHKPITNNKKIDKKEINFDDFRAVYPRKDGLEGSRSAWSWAVQSGADPNQIVRAATNYALTAHERIDDKGNDFNMGARKFIESKEYLREDLDVEPPKPIDLGDLEPWQEQIVKRFGAEKYTSWFRQTSLDEGVLLVKTSFVADWIKTHFLQDLGDICSRVEVRK